MKKIFYAIPIILFAPVLAFAQSTPTVQLPSTFTADILSQATALLASMSNFVTLIVGVLLALVVIEFVIGAIRHRQ